MGKVLVTFVSHNIGPVKTGFTLVWCHKEDEANVEKPFEESHINQVMFLQHARNMHQSGVIDYPDYEGVHRQIEILEPFEDFVKTQEVMILHDYLNSNSFNP